MGESSNDCCPSENSQHWLAYRPGAYGDSLSHQEANSSKLLNWKSIINNIQYLLESLVSKHQIHMFINCQHQTTNKFWSESSIVKLRYMSLIRSPMKANLTPLPCHFNAQGQPLTIKIWSLYLVWLNLMLWINTILSERGKNHQ